MTESHLSPEQISERVSGGYSAMVESHLNECGACRAEVDRLEHALGHFRASLHQWSDEQYRAAPVPVRHSWVGLRNPAWAAAALMTVLVVCLSLAWPLGRYRQAESAASDAALLNQVHEEVSRTVPRPMEPLSRLITWEMASDAQPATGQKIEKQ
jgi:anti-sigma factor RsiW